MIKLKNIILVIITALISLAICSPLGAVEKIELKISKRFERIKAKVIKKIALPRGYHEGLYFDESAMWVLNGNGIKTWVVNVASGQITSIIEPIASFSEGMSTAGDGRYFVTDWNEKKLYKANFDGKRFKVEAAASVAPGLPAGVLWTGSRLFVIIWTRGFGTKYTLLEMDKDMNIIDRISIRKIEEPDHLAWDGENMWITSWYSQKVYKININSMEIVGVMRSPVPRTTGIAWDGKYLWLTGTYSDLYQLELV